MRYINLHFTYLLTLLAVRSGNNRCSYVVRWTPCEQRCWPCHRTDNSEAWCCQRRPPPLDLCAALSMWTYNNVSITSWLCK